MPPKKDPSKSKKNKQTEGNKDGKKRPKRLPKGAGMGGTIGLAEKKEKDCKIPSIKSFSRPPACCPQEIGCPIPVYCPTAPPACPQTNFISSPPSCCPHSHNM